MITISQVLFWAILPLICILFRIKKKIKTSFTLFGIFTSLLLGLLFTGTFQKIPLEQVVNFMNENRFEEAKRELKFIIQNKPDDLEKIETGKIINIVAFERMKVKIAEEYLAIANRYINYRINEKADCNVLYKEKESLTALENSLRLLEMAESIGEEQPQTKKKIMGRIKKGNEIISRIEEKCQ